MVVPQAMGYATVAGLPVEIGLYTWLVETVSEATITGLMIGVGLTIIADQLPKLLGIDSADGGFVADVGSAVSQLAQVNTATVVVSVTP